MTLLNNGTYEGLSEEEAKRRLAKDGYNELPSREKRSITTIIGDVIREPMFLLLVAAGCIYFILGDIEEGIILLSFVFVIIGITVYQEQKTEKALEALRNLSSPRAVVIRNGVHSRIAGREVVRGDLLLVNEGDRIAADAHILSSVNLTVDESLLTGESVPVRKIPVDILSEKKPGGDDQPWLYSGTLVVQGQGVAEVISTGIHTEMGRIGKALQTVEREKTGLHKETSRIVRSIAFMGILLCALVVIVYGVTRIDWLGGFLAGITLAMAILPEEFPVVLTVFLALGAWRLSRHNVLTRHVPAIETLGAATVLAVDKTGTLTQNRMTVACVARGNSVFHSDLDERGFLPEELHEVLEYAVLSSKKDPFDPMERALLDMGKDSLSGTRHLHGDWELVVEYPLSHVLLAMSNVWRSRTKDEYIIAAKGAPEAIADLCHLGDEEAASLRKAVECLAADGLRVIGVAKATFGKQELPKEQHVFIFSFIGLIGFADPVRPDAPSAIRECYEAGIRVMMITGDYPATAQYIGRKIGLADVDTVLTGDELENISNREAAEKVSRTSIIARVIPEQKLHIVDFLKADGEIVAMTGDGVNDAPALKSANIGIAMGKRGTDVAREASSLVLLDDNFASIVAAVRMGRRIYQNLKKAMAYIISIHVPIAGISVLPVLFGWPLILLPVHIVFLELIIDPACSIVFEAEREEPDIMRKPPRNPGTPLLDRKTTSLALLQGFIVLGFVLGVYLSAVSRGLGQNECRTLAFITIVVANLALICANRSWTESSLVTLRHPNKAFWWVTGGTAFFLLAVITLPVFQGIFKFSSLTPTDIFVAVVAGILSVVWFDVYKSIHREE
jgi:Ca2+-transporting ATPase